MKIEKPPIVQMCDLYRDYYKIVSGFFCDYKKVIRTNKIEDNLTLIIESEQMPDIILFNSKQYKLISYNENT